MKKKKPIHFAFTRYIGLIRTACDRYLDIYPIEDVHDYMEYKQESDTPLGTFNINKVTCKKCLKSTMYKDAVDKDKYSLFYWRERI